MNGACFTIELDPFLFETETLKGKYRVVRAKLAFDFHDATAGE